MSPYHTAVRSNGTCTGSLWKSHSRHRGSSMLSFSSSISNGNAFAARHDTSQATAGIDSPEPAFSLDGILAEANERQRAHEFCVLVGNTLWSYSDVWAYAKGDPPTCEIRIVGSSAWNPLSVTRTSNPRHKLASSPSAILASEAISTPSLMFNSVDFVIVTYSGTHVRCSAPTPLDKDKWLAALHSGLEGNIMENRAETLMVLSKRYEERPEKKLRHYRHVGSNRGTGKSCRGLKCRTKSDMVVQTAVSSALATFESEISFSPFVPPLPRVEVTNVRSDRKINNPSSHPEGDLSTSYIHSGCGITTDSTTGFPTTGYHSPCDDWSAPLSDTHCTACGRYPPQHAMRIDAAPLPEYGMEVRVDLCHDCWIAQGVLQHIRYLGWLYEVEARDRAAIRMAWDEVKGIMDWLERENAGSQGEVHEVVQTQTSVNQYQSADTSLSSDGINEDLLRGDFELPITKDDGKGLSRLALPPLASDAAFHVLSTVALLKLICTDSFVAYRQRSNTLDSLCQVLEMRGVGSAPDFLESIEESSQAGKSSCFYSGEQELGDGSDNETMCPRETICLKKEAFKVAGDMSAALKLLYEYALPPESRNVSPKSPPQRDNADMLAAILEFFLDLCDERQTEAVAFFWPQLCHIHMQMLPPRDTEEMIRVELMEDFLLTVATRNSVHLALSLVWGLTADLEESLGSSNCNPLSRQRRYSILRFVSELESVLFDFEGGWGGGGVSLHGMLSPSQHQAALLRDSMSLLQLRRRFGSHFLTRSVRLDKLRAEALESLGDFCSSTAEGAGVRARISKNAAYFSSHITFARKLGDVAEKLRFMGLDQRPEALREELKEINALGQTLGGDPLNRLCGDGRFFKAVNIPINEGHVFRSKERTPVLLLAELVKDPPETTISLMDQLTTDIAGMVTNEEVDASSVSHERKKLPNHRTQCTDDPSLMSHSSSSIKNISHREDESEDGSLSCPHLPCHLNRARDYSFTESSGRFSHRVLALTPRSSEATNVTKEGKEMMADMIATLIVNRKNHRLAPRLDVSSKHTVYNDHDEMRQYYQPTELDNRGDQCKDAMEGAMAQSRPGSKGWKPSALNRAYDAHISPEIDRDYGKKFSALGSVFPQSGQPHSSADFSKSSGVHLTADGQFRRDVLFAIMERGMRGSNVIAKGAAAAARRAIQAMDRKRAIALMNESTTDTDILGTDLSKKESEGSSLGSNKRVSSEITTNASIDESEVMDALRLLIIQNQVAQENLSLESALKPNATGLTDLEADSEIYGGNQRGVDAGDVDHRLAGCGQISSSVLSALRLWKRGIVSNGELLELVQKDLQFIKQSAVFGSSDEYKLIEDSAFWGRFSFGERWAEKKARLAASSLYGSMPGWDLIGCIVKSNDDLRQEAFVMQLIGLCEEAFRTAGLDLWIHPYGIVATGLTTGIIECVRNAMSFDSLKKRPGYGTDGLVGHFERMTEIAADPCNALNEAKQNFVSSLAAYSLMSYLFMFKDRHNGNLLLDTAGHLIHIDFGFVFGIAPGGSFSLEQSTPFKLTDEMLEVMGGLGSPLFSEFVTLFCCGFLALQAHTDTFLTIVEVTCRGSSFPCFDGKDPEEVLSKLRERFCPERTKSQTVAYALDLIKFATTSYGTKQYDYFQYLSQGIAT